MQDEEIIEFEKHAVNILDDYIDQVRNYVYQYSKCNDMITTNIPDFYKFSNSKDKDESRIYEIMRYIYFNTDNILRCYGIKYIFEMIETMHVKITQIRNHYASASNCKFSISMASYKYLIGYIDNLEHSIDIQNNTEVDTAIRADNVIEYVSEYINDFRKRVINRDSVIVDYNELMQMINDVYSKTEEIMNKLKNLFEESYSVTFTNFLIISAMGIIINDEECVRCIRVVKGK